LRDKVFNSINGNPQRPSKDSYEFINRSKGSVTACIALAQGARLAGIVGGSGFLGAGPDLSNKRKFPSQFSCKPLTW